MAVAFAASLGAIAMATVILRGALAGETAAGVIPWSLWIWVVFSAVGYAAGAALDALVRQDLETQFRRRLEHFRKEVETGGGEPQDGSHPHRQDA